MFSLLCITTYTESLLQVCTEESALRRTAAVEARADQLRLEEDLTALRQQTRATVATAQVGRIPVATV